MNVNYFTYGYNANLSYPWSPAVVPSSPGALDGVVLLSAIIDRENFGPSPALVLLDQTCQPVPDGIIDGWSLSNGAALSVDGKTLAVVCQMADPNAVLQTLQPLSSSPNLSTITDLPCYRSINGILMPGFQAPIIQYNPLPAFANSSTALVCPIVSSVGFTSVNINTRLSAASLQSRSKSHDYPYLMRLAYMSQTKLASVPHTTGTVLCAVSAASFAQNIPFTPTSNLVNIGAPNASCKFLFSIADYKKDHHDFGNALVAMTSYNSPPTPSAWVRLAAPCPGPITSNVVADASGQFLFYAVWNPSLGQSVIYAWDGLNQKVLWTQPVSGTALLTGDMAICGTTLYAADLGGNLYIITNCTTAAPSGPPMQTIAAAAGIWLTSGVFIRPSTPPGANDLICVCGSSFDGHGEFTGVYVIDIGNAANPSIQGEGEVLYFAMPGLMPFMQKPALLDKWLFFSVVAPGAYPPVNGAVPTSAPLTLYKLDITSLYLTVPYSVTVS